MEVGSVSDGASEPRYVIVEAALTRTRFVWGSDRTSFSTRLGFHILSLSTYKEAISTSSPAQHPKNKAPYPSATSAINRHDANPLKRQSRSQQTLRRANFPSRDSTAIAILAGKAEVDSNRGHQTEESAGMRTDIPPNCKMLPITYRRECSGAPSFPEESGAESRRASPVIRARGPRRRFAPGALGAPAPARSSLGR